MTRNHQKYYGLLILLLVSCKETGPVKLVPICFHHHIGVDLKYLWWKPTP